MSTPQPSGPTPAQEYARAQAERVLGPSAAKRLATFENGVLYVRAGGWARILAWLVDFLVWVLGLGVGFLVVGGVARAADLDNQVLLIGVIAVLFLMPLLYGWLCYRNGRALGAVITGIQLVRGEDGSRIGSRAPAAMLIRVLMPLLVIGLIAGVLGGGGSAPSDSTFRVSVDLRAVRRLRAAGIA